MASKHSAAIRGGWMSPNEVRQVEGLPPVDAGDEVMAARDLIPLRFLLAQQDLPPTPDGVKEGD
jgi:hypothetical protein